MELFLRKPYFLTCYKIWTLPGNVILITYLVVFRESLFCLNFSITRFPYMLFFYLPTSGHC